MHEDRANSKRFLCSPLPYKSTDFKILEVAAGGRDANFRAFGLGEARF